jgi:hypothetical protein
MLEIQSIVFIPKIFLKMFSTHTAGFTAHMHSRACSSKKPGRKCPTPALATAKAKQMIEKFIDIINGSAFVCFFR